MTSCMFPGSMISAGDFHALKLPVRRGHEDPVAVVQMQDRGGRNLRVSLPASGRGTWPSQTCPRRIIPGLRTSMRTLAVRRLGSRIAPMLLILPWKTLVGIGVQTDFGGVAQAHIGQVVFVHIADDPDLGKVGNRERICAQCLHARGIRDLLVGDHSRDGRRRCPRRRSAYRDRCRAAGDARPSFRHQLWPCLRCPGRSEDRSSRWRRERRGPSRVRVAVRARVSSATAFR